MKSLRIKTLAACLAAAGLLLSACGGGGDGGDTTAAGGADPVAPAPEVSLTQGSQTYRMVSQFGVAFDLTVDLDERTYAYSANGVNMSGAITATATGTYLLNTGLSASNLRAELRIKDGGVGGTLLLKSPGTNTIATSIVAGANTKLIVNTPDAVVGDYFSMGPNTLQCIEELAVGCQEDVGGRLTFSKTSATGLKIEFCDDDSAALETYLQQGAANCPTDAGQSQVRSSAFTIGSDGKFAPVEVGDTTAFELFFASFGGKVVGFLAEQDSDTDINGVTRTTGTLELVMPANSASQASEFTGVWDMAGKIAQLSMNVQGLTGITATEVTTSGTDSFTIDTLALNDWGNGVNVGYVTAKNWQVPVFVAGPWAALYNDAYQVSYIGLKR